MHGLCNASRGREAHEQVHRIQKGAEKDLSGESEQGRRVRGRVVLCISEARPESPSKQGKRFTRGYFLIVGHNSWILQPKSTSLTTRHHENLSLTTSRWIYLISTSYSAELRVVCSLSRLYPRRMLFSPRGRISTGEDPLRAVVVINLQHLPSTLDRRHLPTD